MTQRLINDATIGDIITSAAEHHGADPIACLCVAFTESGFNPKAKGDWTLTGPEGPFVTADTPGARPTSFGLYQLHEGGELGSLTEAEVFNPITNANTAIPHIAAVAHEHPDWSPGEIVAAAQGPANATEYASVINALYDEVKAGRYPPGWEVGANNKTGLSVFLNEPAPTPEPAPKSVTVTLPVLAQGDGMPPSQPDHHVKILQTALSLGGVDVAIDGMFGPDTDEALKTFQAHHGLVINGLTDAATWEKLL